MAVLTDLVIVVTGASSGIGLAVCLALAPQRPRLVLAARNVEKLDQVALRCQELGAQTLVVQTDVTKPGDCANLMQRTIDQFGQLDVLVNNAGIAVWTSFKAVRDVAVMEQVMRVNYLGAVYCTHEALPHLRKSRGRLVMIASMAGLTGVPMLSGYCASKHALLGFSDSLRLELAGSGVTVSVVAPDFVQTDIFRNAVDGAGKKLPDSPLDDESMLAVERCAKITVRAIERRRPLSFTSFRGGLLRWGKLLAPWLVDRIVRASVETSRK